jgi:predicted DsbA family dithiol-disulfide isomerase
VEWKAFELRPGLPLEGIPRPLKPGQKNELASSVKTLSDEVGLKMKRPEFVACSRPALEAAEYAKDQMKFDEFHLSVFKAYWEDGKNIGQRSVLCEIASECGMDGNKLEEALKEGRYAGRVNEQNEEARVLGITGIPAYIIGGYLVEGAQPYQIFKRAVELVQQEKETKE